MKQEKLNNTLFKEESCPDADLLYAYANAKMNEDDAWTIEDHLTSCKLCNDAVEGMLLISGTAVLDEVLSDKTQFMKAHASKSFFYEHKNALLVGAASLAIMAFFLFKTDKPAEKKQEVITPVITQPLIKTEVPAKEIPVAEKAEIIKPPAVKRELKREINIAAVTENIAEPIAENPVTVPEKVITEKVSDDIVLPKENEKLTALTTSALKIIYINDLKAIDYIDAYSGFTSVNKPILNNVAPWLENDKARDADAKFALRTDTVFYKDVLGSALNNFATKNYAIALKEFNLILSVYNDDQNALFYSGLCYLETADFETANNYLYRIKNHRNSPFEEEAEWFIAVVQYKQMKDELAKKSLEKIVARNNFYAKQARVLLNELK